MSIYATVEEFHTEIIAAIMTVTITSVLLILWRGLAKHFHKDPLNQGQPDSHLSEGEFGFPVEKYLIKRKDLEQMSKPCQPVKPSKSGGQPRIFEPKGSDTEEELMDDNSADVEPLVKSSKQPVKRSTSQNLSVPTAKDAGRPRRASESKLAGEEISAEMFAEQFPTVFKNASLRKATKLVEKNLTEDEKLTEAQIKQKQLESIFSLMKQQEDKFGVSSISDVQEQLKLYAL